MLRWSERVSLLSDYVGGRTVPRIAKHSGLPESDVSKILEGLLRQARSKDASLPGSLPASFDRHAASRLRAALHLCASSKLRVATLIPAGIFLGFFGIEYLSLDLGFLKPYLAPTMAAAGLCSLIYWWWQAEGIAVALQHDGDVRAIVEKKRRNQAEQRERSAVDAGTEERSHAGEREKKLLKELVEARADSISQAKIAHQFETALSSEKSANGELRRQVEVLQADKAELIKEVGGLAKDFGTLEARNETLAAKKDELEASCAQSIAEQQSLRRSLTRIQTRDEDDVRRLGKV